MIDRVPGNCYLLLQQPAMKKSAVVCPACGFESPAGTSACERWGTGLPAEGDTRFARTMTMMTPAPELRRGEVIAGRYEVIEGLGRGGMGSVFRVDDKKVEEEVALKLINPEIARDRGTIERFRHELWVARRISHRNVCRMHDLGEAETGNSIRSSPISG